MKILPLLVLAALVISVSMLVGFYLGLPTNSMRHRLRMVTIKRVKIETRSLKSVVQDIVNQVESQDNRRIEVRVIFSPENLGGKSRVGFGNPPIEGKADHALYLVGADYNCYFSCVGNRTIIFSEHEP